VSEVNEKLQKVLARAGLGSRREIEQWIAAGRVSVNNTIAKVGDRVSLDAKIKLDGKPINITIQTVPRILLYYKPEGEICSRHDPEGRPTVYDHLPKLIQGRWISIGRLDINSSGLLLFTNDGELANRLMHPSFNVEREYAARVYGQIDDEILKRLTRGVNLEDGKARFEKIMDAGGEGKNRWFHVVVKEGRNRLVRRLWESQGVTVSRLIRIRYSNVSLPRPLRPGRYVELEKSEIDKVAIN
jgi:23S rRNA pseudouridine2605 synthase